MKTYGYGHDFGNSETCGVMLKDGKTLSKTIPSVTSIGNGITLGKLGVEMHKNHFVFSMGGTNTELFVGDLALEQGDDIYVTRGDIARYWSDVSLALLLVTAASLNDEKEFGLNVVTGLPVQTYLGNPECRKNIKQALDGHHNFSLNGRERTIHVKVLKVIMEGAGAAIAYGSTEDVLQGVVDIGGRTTDLYVAKGQTPIMKLCNGDPLGVESAGELLNTNFTRKYGIGLDALEIRQILRASVSNSDYPSIKVRHQEVRDIPALATEALSVVGKKISSFVSRSWNKIETGMEVASKFDSVLCIGGGAYYFYNDLENLIHGVTFIEKPEQANAYGYAVFAEQQRLSLSAAS